MQTIHEIYFRNSNHMKELSNNSIDLVVTSPPYPMIEMWDHLFSRANEEIGRSLQAKKGKRAFELMHNELNKVWSECIRVVKPGGYVCINIGDATRKIDSTFQLFPNHVKITNFFQNSGFISLPFILWRKPTNSPTKFLGSGMLPPNAYVTLEHEYILIYRKGFKIRKFKPKFEIRYNSAYFWEERNKWFSDLWTDVKGISQNIEKDELNSELRNRSAAFPLEIPYRLINMFSLIGDNVLDPFWGTGTTTLAAIGSARNSIGYELNSDFNNLFLQELEKIKTLVDLIYTKRIKQHLQFIKDYTKKRGVPKYLSNNYGFPIITKQEQDILFYDVKSISINSNKVSIKHTKYKLE
ncbi:MAG: site-specific DNA-methyltransferase [Candidatus Lokiarchaeota archaeon]|nr:site-specific DNA-methyltransferase [Candidatus Lokiarchaeota archaeon]